MLSGLLRLYRLDAFLIFLLVYVLGAVAAGGTLSPVHELFVALLISGISFNFVYSLNSWADADIDAINKPSRPIPSGAVTRPQALAYSLVLLAASLAYPFILFVSSAQILLCLWIPVAGILYSNPVYPLKKKRLLALLTITVTVLAVAALGYISNGGVFDTRFYFLTLALFIVCIAVIPLKDLSDVEGDKAHGAENWFAEGARGGMLRRIPPHRLYRSVLIAIIVLLALVIGYAFYVPSIFIF